MAQEQKRRRGYVYVLSNPSMPGIVKVGRTFREPRARAAELSAATGVPTPFKIEATVSTWNCVWLEKLVHIDLRRCRVNSNREFFRCTVEEALETTKKAADGMKGSHFRSASTKPSGVFEWVGALMMAAAGYGWLQGLPRDLAVGGIHASVIWIAICGIAMVVGWPRWIGALLLIPGRLKWIGVSVATGLAILPWVDARYLEYGLRQVLGTVL